MLFSDVTAEHYLESQHNVWHDDALSENAYSFYGPARRLVHERFLAEHPPAGDRTLLDVGCGLGFFVERAIAGGWDAHGCDTSPAWVARARERAGAGRIRLGGPREAFEPEARFAMITAWDVLEHVHDPLPFLHELRTRLAPGGRLFLRTPNEAWVIPTYAARRSLGETVELGPLNHVVLYRSSTLTEALRLAGLRPAAWPCLPPPQVGLGNRESTGRRVALVKRLKNVHASTARAVARVSDGRLVIGSDLDVLAVGV